MIIQYHIFQLISSFYVSGSIIMQHNNQTYQKLIYDINNFNDCAN